MGNGEKIGEMRIIRVSTSMRLLILIVALFGFGERPAYPLPEYQASDSRTLDEIVGTWSFEQGGMGWSPPVQSFEIQEHVDVLGQIGSGFELRVIRTRANHFRLEISRPGRETEIQASDGRLGWQMQPQWGFGIMPASSNDEWIMQSDLLLALKAFDPHSAYRLLGPAVVNGRPCIAANFILEPGIEEKCYFDREKHQLLRIERTSSAGSPNFFSAEFDDFRLIGGLMIPYTAKFGLGQVVVVHRRSKVTINPPVDEAIFVASTAQVEDALAVEAILKRHDEAVGGVEELERIKTRVTKLSVENSTTGTSSSVTISQKSPNLILEESDTPGIGHEVRGFDGTNGWMDSELQGYRPLKDAELKQLTNEGGIHFVGRLGESYPFRRRLGERVVDGRPTFALALANHQGPAGTFYFDKETGLLLRMGLVVAGDRENYTESTVDFSDFRSIDGAEIPFVLVETTPLMRVVSTVRSVQNNVPLTDGIFQPRRED